MPIKKIKIINAAGFQEYEAILPAITFVKGKNKKGKTALLSCITYPHDRGHDPDMFTPFDGAEFGEIIQEMEDGTSIRARITKAGTDRFTKPKDGKSWKKGRELIDQMSESITYAPLRLMDLSEKELLDAVLKVMPLRMDESELETALGELVSTELMSITGRNVLEQIGSDTSGIYGAIYGRRRAINSEADGLTKHADQLLKTMPPAAPDGSDWEGEAKAVGQALKDAEAAQRAELSEARTTFESIRTAAAKALQEALRTAEEVRDAAIQSAKDEYDRLYTENSKEYHDYVEKMRAGSVATADACRAHHGPQITKLTADLATAQERARASIEAKTTQANANTAKTEAMIKQDTAKVMTAALNRLIALKQTIASRLQIKGVAFENGRIGRLENKIFVPFQKWNRADRMSFCLKIGLLANKAGFVVVDDTEAWDAENRAALHQACVGFQESKGVQFILASVAAGDLSVTDGRGK